MNMRFLMIVGNAAIARFSFERGVGRLFVDLERNGKAERQKHVQSWKSDQTNDDVTAVREAVPEAHLLVRLNPLHDGSRVEVDDAISRGADSLMLPMFRTFDELAIFHGLVAGRASIVPLCETLASLATIPAMIDKLGIAELHIGMNDLHLDLGHRFIFEPLARGILEEPCAFLRERGVPFGIGGLARAGEGIVPPDMLIGEHVRLGSDAAILSRSFHRNAKSIDEMESSTKFAEEVQKLQAIYRSFVDASPAELQANRQSTADRIFDVVRVIEQSQAQ